MLKKPYLLPFILLFSPFLVWPQDDTGYWVSMPSGDTLVIIGVSNRRLRRDWEIESARDDAARKLLFYYGVTGTVRTVLVGGQTSTETTLEPRSAAGFDAIRETLRFDREKDVKRTDNVVFVRFICSAPGAESLEREPAVFVNGEPLWLHRPVRIAGYITGVGFSGPQRYLKDTITRSYENAAAALIVSLSAQMETLDHDVRSGLAASGITEIAKGELTGFMVLEMWIDPKTKAVWTLAAARRGS